MFDLSDSESATVDFWHKYNTIDGANGAYIMVGYLDPTVDTGPVGAPRSGHLFLGFYPINLHR